MEDNGSEEEEEEGDEDVLLSSIQERLASLKNMDDN